MKTTLTTNQVAHKLLADDNAGWSYAGANALAEYLEQYEEDCGEEIELDIVALRCDWSESTSLADWAEGYFGTVNGKSKAFEKFDVADGETLEDKEDAIREYINDHGQLIEFDGGVIVSAF